MKILAMDEAGRGCVLGPLVVGGFVCEDSAIDAVVATGATDSKKLSAKKREALCLLLAPLGEALIVEISVAEIDAGNINALEERAFAQLIQRHAPDRVYIDAPTNTAGVPALKRRLWAAVAPLRPELIVEPKADLTYPVVGAASIFAKVHRDAQLGPLGPVGSGYPSDPVTRAWLKDRLREGALPACVRSRWGTIENLRQEMIAEEVPRGATANDGG